MGTTLRQRLRYRFDNLMARGVGAQILLLAAITAALILLATIAVLLYGDVPTTEKDDSVGEVIWISLMHAFDAGTLGADPFAWGYLAIMLMVTLGGIFVLSALIGILNNGFGNLIESLRRGRSTVIEDHHTVVLGYSPKIHTLLRELAAAGANQRDACVVVLADRDKVAMDDELRDALGDVGLRVVTRSGNPMNMHDLALVNLEASKAVVVLAPETHPDGAAMAAHESDTVVLKTLLAIAKVSTARPLHIVAELQDEKTEAVARMVVGPAAALIVSPPLISRLLVQTGRQSGLSVVYTELLDFGGVEMYVKAEPAVTGRTFREVVFDYDTSTVLGVLGADDQLLLPPPFDRPFAAGDRLVVISEDDDTIVRDGRPATFAEDVVVARPHESTRHRERTLVLGASARLGLVLRELDAYVTEGSETLVVGEAPALADIDTTLRGLGHMQVTHRAGDITDRATLDGLDIPSFDHVLVLSETAGRSQEMADARTMVTLLHLRDLLRRRGAQVAITSEILQIENRDLAAVAEADDFIVSNTLVSLMVSQVAENRHLVRVFADLFSAGGHEIYLKPVEDYVKVGGEVPFAAVAEAALRRGEVALGLRLAGAARDPDRAFGVVVNPTKSRAVPLAAGDKVIVLADD